MKIFHVSGAKSWGGNEQQLVSVIPELNKNGVENIVLGIKGSPLQKYCIKYGIQFISVFKKKLINFNNIKYFKKIIDEINPSVIHLHTSDSVTLFVLSDRIFNLKTPTVFSKKGISKSVSYLSKLKYNYKNINKIICVSEAVKIHFKEVLFPKNHYKLKVVHDGVLIHSNDISPIINIKNQLKLTSDVKVIGNIANHTRAKDLTTFIKTLEILVHKKKIKNIHFVQIGEETKSTNNHKALVHKFKLEKYITFLGFQKYAAALLPQFDVFLMTSEREGGPTSVLEAFSKKVPVVSTRVGVINEVIVDGKNGFVANVGDYQTLADKIEILLNNKKLIEEFKEISFQKYVSLFTIKTLGENTLKVYKSLIVL